MKNVAKKFFISNFIFALSSFLAMTLFYLKKVKKVHKVDYASSGKSNQSFFLNYHAIPKVISIH